MSGWAVAGLAVAAWLALSPLVGLALGRLIRHGEQQPRAGRHAPTPRPSWARDTPTRRRTRRHRR